MLSMTSRNRSHRRDSYADSGAFDRPEYARSQSRPASLGWRDSLPADILKASDLASINSNYEFDLSINSSTRFTVAMCELPPSIADLTGTCPEGEFAAEIDFQAKYSEQKSVMSFDTAAGQLNASVSKTDSAWSWQQSLSSSLGTPAETICYSSQSTYQFNLQSDQFNTSIAMSSSQSVTTWRTNQPLPPASDPKLISPCDGFPSLDFQSKSRTETLSMTKGNDARIDLNFQAFSETRLTEFAAAGDFGKQSAGLLQQNSQLGLAAFG